MATARTLNGAIDLQPRTLPLRRFLSGVTTYLTAIREGGAAAHDYNQLLQQGVPHDEAVQRVFDDHFANR